MGLFWALSAPARAAEADAGLVLDPGPLSKSASLLSDPDLYAFRVTESINDGTADQILTGSQADERFGIYAMDSAGDVDGDGYVDIIVGSYRYDMDGDIPINTFDGIVYIFPGSASGVEATPIVSVTIGQAEARFGSKVAGLGDVNGDGYPDIAVSAYYYDAPTNNEGAVFIYYGAASGISNTPSITLTGVATTTYLGVGVAGAGDVNGDGYADLIAAGHGYDNGEENEGAAFIYHGSAAGLSATPAVTIENNITDTQLRAVAGAGDVNGDGYADVIIGSGGYNSSDGIAYVHHGSASGISATPAVTLTSAQASDYFANGLDGAGDVNGDGYADVVVGAMHHTNPEDREGAFFVYLGSAAGISATPSITVESNLAVARLGNAVAGVGDVDGDGYADVLVGARIYDLPYNDAGAAFLYHGTADGIDAANPVWFSPVTERQYGFNVARAGDVNADGYADILVAQDYYPIPHGRAGAVYIYHGGGDDLQSTAVWTAAGESNGTFFGKVASAGDGNGDGFSDVIVGAYGYMTNTGRAYLYLGAADGPSATPTLTLTGENEGDRFGQFVATAGDVNGDGYADAFVGATGYMTNTGRAYLYHGGPGGLSATPAITLTGENEGDSFGRGGTAGDVNGDGYADIIIGANNYLGGAGQGKIYLYHGSAAGLIATPVFTASGENVGDNFAVSLSTAGDVNGDGYADVVVGASSYGGSNNYGRLYVYYGSATGLTATDLVSVTGTTYNERLGVAVSTAGDVNGDGYADVVAGGDYYASQAGIAYVFQGGPTGLDTTPIFAESDASPHFGRAVGTAGDVNGDGYADIVVGTSTYSGFTNRRGRILVYYGSSTGVSGTPVFIATGEVVNSRFGSSLGTAGDVNGDGFSELIVGAPNYPNNNALGKVYLYSSGMGRPVMAGQTRGDGSGTPVQTWGLSYDADGFTTQINATDPRGRGYVKLQVEACPAGMPFGDASCVGYIAPDWTMTGLSGAVLGEKVTGLVGDTVYAWRARVVYDSHANPYGPWRRYLAPSLVADLRVGTPPDVAIEKAVVPAIVGPGQMVTYTLVFSNAGSLAAPGVLVADHVPVTLTNVHYAATRPVTTTGAFSYTWEVGTLGANEGGVITVTGVVSSGVTGVFGLTNEATISAPNVTDGDPNNSTSTVSNTVDADPPAIVAVRPSAGAEGVALSAPVVITFGEAIDTGTFGYAITPDPGSWASTWNGDNTVVTLTHQAFDAAKVYTVTVTAADDLVGNALVGSPYKWSFETAHYQIYLPIVLKE